MLKVIRQTPNSAKVALWVIWPVQKHYRNLMYHHWWQATAAAQYSTFLYLSFKIFLVVFVLRGRIVGRNNEGYHKQGNFFCNSSLLSLERILIMKLSLSIMYIFVYFVSIDIIGKCTHPLTRSVLHYTR